MGINGLWKIVHAVSRKVDLTEYATEHGFLPKYNGTRTLHIGIDASVTLDGYSAAQFTRGRFFHHATSDPSLTQLFKFLTQLSNTPTDCTFVYDGTERPDSKRGKKVIKQEPLLYRKSRELVEAFGYRTHIAKGDAEAELAVMNRRNIIDAVLTKDCDVFPLGARLVFRIVPHECTDTKLVVNVYDAGFIETKLKLTTGGLILYSLLAGNDFDSGVQSFGPTSALAVAQCGFGNSIVDAVSPAQRRARFKNIKEKIIKSLTCSTDKRALTRAQKLANSNFPSQEALVWFLDAPTSWSELVHAPNTTAWHPQGHNLARIAKFCMESIGWSASKTLTQFEQMVWRGAIVRILCSKFLAYDPATGSLLSPLRQTALYRVNGSRPFAITNSTTIQGRNPPNLATKKLGDTVRITFDVSELVELTLLRVPSSCHLKSSLSIFVPFAIIAAATGQRNLIHSIATPATIAPPVMDSASDDDVEVIGLQSNTHLRIAVLDFTSIDDIL